MRRIPPQRANALAGAPGVAFEEDGGHAQAMAELDVGERVADHEASVGGDLGEVGAGLMEEAGERLAAVALLRVVRAEVEGVDMRAVRLQLALEGGVNLAHVAGGVEAEGDASLVGDDDDAQTRAVEASDGLRYAGQWLKLAPGSNVAAFRQLAVEDSVAVQEDGAQGSE